MASTRGRAVVVPLTNKSGGAVAVGDVVITDSANDESFTTTTSSGSTGGVGIAQEAIANNATGRVLVSGYAALVNVNASVTRGNFGKTHTVAKQATDAGSSRGVGTFCQFLKSGTTPSARVYSTDLNNSAGSVASDAIFDAKGDLAVGTGADTAAKLTVDSSNDSVLVAMSGASTGLGYRRHLFCYKGSDESKSSTSYADSTNMGLAVAAGKTYKYRFVVLYDTNASTVGIKLGLHGPSGTVCYCGTMIQVGVASTTSTAMIGKVSASADISTDMDCVLPDNGPGTGGGGGVAILEGIITTTNAGTLQLRHASETATATTIKTYSHGELWEIA